jgi:hypothetical protein
VLERIQTDAVFRSRVFRDLHGATGKVEEAYYKAVTTPDANGKYDTKAQQHWLANRSSSWRINPDESPLVDELVSSEKQALYLESGVEDISTADVVSLRRIAAKLITARGTTAARRADVTDAEYVEVGDETGA